MANFNNIYKASELIKLVPEIAPCIEHEDWIHVAISHDPINKMTCLISFIWDTRDIVRCSLYADDEQAIDMLLNNHDNFFISAIANDNHTWLKIRRHEDLQFIDYILDVNYEVMNVPMKLKLKCTTTTNSDCIEREYYINGIYICRTTKDRQCFNTVDKKTSRPSLIRDNRKNAYSTAWSRNGIEELFGMQDQKSLERTFVNDRYSLRSGYSAHAASSTEIKNTIRKMFNVEF